MRIYIFFSPVFFCFFFLFRAIGYAVFPPVSSVFYASDGTSIFFLLPSFYRPFSLLAIFPSSFEEGATPFRIQFPKQCCPPPIYPFPSHKNLMAFRFFPRLSTHLPLSNSLLFFPGTLTDELMNGISPL